MTKSTLDLRHLFDEFTKNDIPAILDVLIAAGQIGNEIALLPEPQRLQICANLRKALQGPDSDLNGLGQLVIEASVKISEDAGFLKRLAIDLENHFNDSP